MSIVIFHCYDPYFPFILKGFGIADYQITAEGSNDEVMIILSFLHLFQFCIHILRKIY